jgi:hypothetical protein
MTGIALMIRGPAHNFPGAIEFVIVVLVIIAVIFVRMYGPRSWFGSRTKHETSHQTVRRTVRRRTHRSERPTAHGDGHQPGHQSAHQPGHQSGHEPGQAVNNGRRSSSKRRAGRP